MVFVASSAVLHAQAPVDVRTISGVAASGASDSLIVSGEWDHIFPGIQGGSGSFDWLHTTEGHLAFLAGGSSSVLDNSHWTIGHGEFIVLKPRWTLETSFRVGHGGTNLPSGGFGYQDYFGLFTYRLSKHLYPDVKEEYVNIGSSYGNLIRAGVCICAVHRWSHTISAAHSAGGNLATEYVSLREEVFSRKLVPYAELSIGKYLPKLVNPVLNVFSSSEHTVSLTTGTRVNLTNRQNLTLAASYVKTGQITTLSLSAAFGIKVRGE
jgi:hypothetical protein